MPSCLAPPSVFQTHFNLSFQKCYMSSVSEKTSKLSQPVKGSLLWWQVSHSIPNLHPRGRGKERGREWGGGRKKEREWFPMAASGKTEGNINLDTAWERWSSLIYSSTEKRGHPQVPGTKKGLYSTPTPRLSCPSSQRGCQRELSQNWLTPGQSQKKGQPEGLFSQMEACFPLLTTAPPPVAYLEHNWGCWSGRGWDCRQGQLPGRLWGNLQRHRRKASFG